MKENLENNKKVGKIKGVILKPEIIKLIDKIREKTGESFSSFVKRCVIEKLENLGLITSPIKKELMMNKGDVDIA